jgi:large subunit ribosomal protein L13
MKTFNLKERDISTAWHVVDAANRPLGRVASEVATLLRGKHKPTYTPHLPMGDFVIVINSAKVRVTGRKPEQKTYYRHTGYIGGLKTTTLEKLLATRPNRVIEHAVRGMLPHNRLGNHLLRRLKVYEGPEHPHEAQVRAGRGRNRKTTKAAGGEVPTE